MILLFLLSICFAQDIPIPFEKVKIPKLDLGSSTPWYVGKNVLSRSILIRGDGDVRVLNKLLALKVGQPINMIHVRQDIQALFLAGSFANVEVIVTPVFALEKLKGVQVRYWVLSAPRIKEINIEGAPRAIRKLIYNNLGISLGQVFYPKRQSNQLVSQLEYLVHTSGWPQAKIALKYRYIHGQHIQLRFIVEPGEEQYYGRINIPGLPKEIWIQAHLLLIKHGIIESKRPVLSNYRRLREDLMDLLVKNGWLQARINIPPVLPVSEDEVSLAIRIEPGRRLRFNVKGKGLPKGRELQRVLGIYPGDRISSSNTVLYGQKILQWLKSKGYPDAKALVEIKESEKDVYIHINVNRGILSQLQKIQLSGLQSISKQKMLSSIYGEMKGLQARVYTEKEWQKAIQLIKDLYLGQGYSQVKVRALPPLQKINKGLFGIKNEIIARAIIKEGQPTKLIKITQKGGVPGIIDQIDLSFKGDYRPKQIEEKRLKIIQVHQEAGYLNVQVKTEEVLDHQKNQATVHFAIEPYKIVKLHSLNIKGNKHTKKKVIQDTVLLELGQPIRPSLINKSRKNLYQLDIFRNVKIEQVGDDETQEDLLVEVQERPNLLFSVGGGVATDQGLQVNTTTTHRNLFGRAHKITFFGRTGYGWDGDSWKLDDLEPVWGATLRYTAPKMPKKKSDLQPDPSIQVSQTQKAWHWFHRSEMEFHIEALFRNQIQEPNYRLDNSGAGLGFRIQPTPKIEGLIEYRLRYISIEDYEPGMIVFGELWDDMLPETNARWSSAFYLSMVWDQRDNSLNPTKGLFSRSQLVLGDGLLSSDPYILFSYNFSNIWDHTIYRFKLANSGGIGRMRYSQTLPFEDRFSLGGASTLRGFYRNSVGPANYSRRPMIDYPSQIGPLIEATALREQSSQWVATGGDYFAAFSTEFQLPLTFLGFGKATYINFIDIGKVSFLDQDVQPDSVALGQEPIFRYSIGAGLRYATPIGPIVIDLGFNPGRKGYRGEEWVLTHLSLGSL